MKIIALGTSKFLLECIRGMFDSGCFFQEIISLPKRFLPDNSIDLKDFAIRIGAEYNEVEDINSVKSKDHIRSLAPDLILSSWPKIIDSELLAIPTHGIIGTHPTALPFNKGRHPLQWEIVLGLHSSKLSFFWMDSNVDSGPIISQIQYNIEPEDTILTLSNRLDLLAYSASFKLGEMLKENKIPKGYLQNSTTTNTWRKRDRFDVLIDFRMDVDDILALIRSFGDPYPCACFIYENYYFNVLSGDKIQLESKVPLEYLEPGRIVKVDGDWLYIKASRGVLKLLCKQNIEYILKSAKYVHPPGKYLAMYPLIFDLFLK